MMRRRLVWICGVLVVVGMEGSALAQPVVRSSVESPSRAHLGIATGFDHALLPMSISGTWTPTFRGRPIRLGGELTVPMAQPDLRDHRVDLRVEAPLRNHDWDIWLGAGVREVGTANDAYRGIAIGTVFSLAAGYHGSRATVAAESSIWLAWLTCISTTSFATELGGAEPWSGCSAWTARTPRLGIRTGMRIGDVELSLHAGYEWRGAYNLAVPPVYARFGVGYRF